MLPGTAHQRRTLRTHRLLQPARGARRRHRAAFSGLPQGDPGGWAAFRAEYDRTHRAVWTAFNEWVVSQGAPELPDLQFMHESAHANLYVYPAEADYDRVRPLGDTWHRIDSSVRETDDDYLLPAAVADRPDGSALVYLSLGSLGGADVDLMRRLVDVLGRTRHRYVVSKGPMGDLIELPDNMVGASIVPQTKVIPQVDLVITHGGNNTTTEALHFGKPMVVLPLFWDQYDNAQRMHELGLGVRLETYAFTDEQLIDAVERLLADTALRARVADIGKGIRERQGLRRGADIIKSRARIHAATEPRDSGGACRDATYRLRGRSADHQSGSAGRGDDPELVDLAIDRGPGHAERLGRLRLVAAGVEQALRDGVTLDRLERAQ